VVRSGIVAVVTVVEAVLAAIVSAASFHDLEFADFIGRERGWKASAHIMLLLMLMLMLLLLLHVWLLVWYVAY